jgi:hypothetical protein
MLRQIKRIKPFPDDNGQGTALEQRTEYCVCIEVDQLDAQILIMCLYLSLSALHASDSLVHHQERRFWSCILHLV